MADHEGALKQLEPLWKKDSTAAERQAAREEAAAYMYQFWKARNDDGSPMLRVGPKVETFFQRVKNFLAETFGMVSEHAQEQKSALDMFSAFDAGTFAKKDDPAQAVLLKKMAESKVLREQGMAIERAFNNNKTLQKAVFSNWQVLKDTRIPALINISKDFHVAEGSTVGEKQPEGTAGGDEVGGWRDPESECGTPSDSGFRSALPTGLPPEAIHLHLPQHHPTSCYARVGPRQLLAAGDDVRHLHSGDDRGGYG